MVPFPSPSHALGKQSCDCWECFLPSRSFQALGGGLALLLHQDSALLSHNIHHQQSSPPSHGSPPLPWKLRPVPPFRCLCISSELLQTIPKTRQRVTQTHTKIRKNKKKKKKKRQVCGPCLLWCGWYGTGSVGLPMQTLLDSAQPCRAGFA